MGAQAHSHSAFLLLPSIHSSPSLPLPLCPRSFPAAASSSPCFLCRMDCWSSGPTLPPCFPLAGAAQERTARCFILWAGRGGLDVSSSLRCATWARFCLLMPKLCFNITFVSYYENILSIDISTLLRLLTQHNSLLLFMKLVVGHS